MEVGQLQRRFVEYAASLLREVKPHNEIKKKELLAFGFLCVLGFGFELIWF